MLLIIFIIFIWKADCGNDVVLKKYVQNGVRTVTDEDDERDEKKDVSPVVHQVGHS